MNNTRGPQAFTCRLGLLLCLSIMTVSACGQISTGPNRQPLLDTLGLLQNDISSNWTTSPPNVIDNIPPNQLAQPDRADTADIYGVRNASLYPGADIGAKVSLAFQRQPCAHVYIPSGDYTFATAIMKPRCAVLEGSGDGRGRSPGQTTLNWKGRGPAIIVGDTDSGTSGSYQQGTIKNFALIGLHSEIGILLGGDPSDSISSRNNGADTETLEHLYIANFTNNIQYGNHSYLTLIFATQLAFAANAAVYYPQGTTDSGENIRISDSKIFNNNIGILNPGGAELNGFGTSFDYNNVAIQGGSFACTLCHFEQAGVPVFLADRSGMTLHLDGGYVVAGDRVSASDSFVYAPGPSSQQLNAYFAGTSFYSARPVGKLLDAPNGLLHESLITLLMPPYEAGHAFEQVINRRNMDLPGLLILDPVNTRQNRFGSPVGAPEVTGASMTLRGLSSEDSTGELINSRLKENGVNYAVKQNQDGTTVVNAAPGKALIFSLGPSAIFTITPTGLRGATVAPSGICTSIGDLMPSQDGHLSQCDATARWYRIH